MKDLHRIPHHGFKVEVTTGKNKGGDAAYKCHFGKNYWKLECKPQYKLQKCETS